MTWRQAVEARVDELLGKAEAVLATLDRMDGDPDLEETEDLEWSVAPNELESDGLDTGELDEAENDTPGYISGGGYHT